MSYTNNYDSTNVYNIIKEQYNINNTLEDNMEYNNTHFYLNHNKEVNEINEILKLVYHDKIDKDTINEITRLTIITSLSRSDLYTIKDNILSLYLKKNTSDETVQRFIKYNYNTVKDIELVEQLISILDDINKYLNNEILAFYGDRIPPNYCIEYLSKDNKTLSILITGVDYDIISRVHKQLQFKHDLYFEQYFNFNIKI